MARRLQPDVTMDDRITNYLIAQADRILTTLKLSSSAERLASHAEPDHVAKALLGKGLLDEAVDAYRDLSSQYPESGFPLYRDLYAHVQAQVSAMARLPAPPRREGRDAPFLVSIPVWGEKYVRTMLAVLLPSLLAPGNLPALAGRRDVMVEFSTGEQFAHLIEAAEAYHALDRIPGVSATIARYPAALFRQHPEAKDYSYRVMGAMHHMSVLRARALGGMNVVLLCCDYILSESLLGTVADSLDEGYEMVLAGSLKVRSDRALPAVLGRLNGRADPGIIAVDAASLTEIALRHMHPECRQLIVSRHTRPFSRLPFPLLFPKPDGFVLRSFVVQPLLVSANLVVQDVMYDYNTVDGVFLSRILGGRDPATAARMIPDSSQGIMLDVTDQRTVKEGDVVTKFDLGSVVGWLFHWRPGGVEPFYKWLFQQRMLFPAGNVKMDTDPDDLDEETTAAVIEHVIGKFG